MPCNLLLPQTVFKNTGTFAVNVAEKGFIGGRSGGAGPQDYLNTNIKGGFDATASSGRGHNGPGGHGGAGMLHRLA